MVFFGGDIGVSLKEEIGEKKIEEEEGEEE